MSTLTLRTVKGTPLTNQEVDDNFSNLNTDKYESGDSPTFADATVDSVQLTGGTGSQGTVSWNTDEETLDVVVSGATLQVGQELFINARNDTVDQIDKGTPVMATGTIGASSRVTIAPMDGTDIANSKYFLGFAAENIAADADGKVTTLGKIRGYDTTGIAAETVLWISTSTAGAVQATEPTTGMKLPVAYVVTGDASNGAILVRANNGAALSAMHDVDLSSPSNGQVLKYDGTKWVNAADATSGPIGELTDVVITSASTGQVLKFDGTNWVNGTDSTTVASIDDIGDVTITTATNGQILQFNGTAWVNGDITLDKALDDLTDVTITTASNGQVLQYDGSGWVNATLSVDKALDDLTDVTITAPSSGEALVYDGSGWANSTVSTVGSIDDLSDVTITTPTTDQVLKYNGTAWVNAADAGGASELNELSDVTITSAASGNLLVNNGTDFINATSYDALVTANVDDSDLSVHKATVTGTQKTVKLGGANTFVTDTQGVYIGYDNAGLTRRSVVLGTDNEITGGTYQVIIGAFSTASGSDSVAIGDSALSEGYDSIAIGYSAVNVSGSNQQISIGSGASTDGSESVAIGVSAFATSDAVAIGLNATASSTDAIAIGENTTASGGDAIAIGNNVSATGLGSTTIGQANTNSGDYSIVIGNNASTSNADCIVIGEQAEGNAEDAIAIGDLAVSGGIQAVAICANSETTGNYAVSIGSNSEAFTDAVAVGRYSIASGNASVGIGDTAEATNDTAVAIGKDSYAYGESSVVFKGGDEYHYNRLSMNAHSSIKTADRFFGLGTFALSTSMQSYQTAVQTQPMDMADGKTFSAGMTLRAGQIVIPTVPNGNQYVVVRRTGESYGFTGNYTAQGTEPTWPTAANGRVIDATSADIEYVCLPIASGQTLNFRVTDYDQYWENPNLKFAVEEVMFICTEYSSVLGAPTFDCGDGVTATEYFNGEAINGITGANQFQKFTPANNILVDKMVFKVNTPASGIMTGKFVVKGFYVNI